MREINYSGGMKDGLEREELEICLKMIQIKQVVHKHINHGNESGNGEVNLSHI